jgi:hypothetical protein
LEGGQAQETPMDGIYLRPSDLFDLKRENNRYRQWSAFFSLGSERKFSGRNFAEKGLLGQKVKKAQRFRAFLVDDLLWRVYLGLGKRSLLPPLFPL